MNTATQAKGDNRFESLSPLSKGAVLTVVIVVLSMFMLLLVEIGVRTRMHFKHGSFWGFEVRSYDSETGLLLPQPNIKRGPIKINSQGFRSPELQPKRETDSLRLAFLGGSTTFSAEVSGNEFTWPAIVTKRLQDTYTDIELDYIGAGVIAYTTIESIHNWNKRVSQHDVDVLFIYHGINDIAFDAYHNAVINGVLAKDKIVPNMPTGMIHKSLLVDLVRKNLTILFGKKQTEEKSLRVQFNKELATERFRYRLEKLVDSAKQSSDLIVLPTFTNKLRTDQTPAEQAVAMETYSFYMPFYSKDDLLKALKSYNDVIREYKGADGVIVLETVNAVASTAENFVDSVHFSDKGSELFGEHIAAKLSASPELQLLISTMSE